MTTIPFINRASVMLCLIAGTVAPGSSQERTRVLASSDREIVLTHTFDAARDRVFDALTQAEQIVKWFQPTNMTLVSCDVDLKVGGTFRYVFRRPSGARIEMRGTFLEIIPPARLVHNESYDFSPLTVQTITILEEVGGRTVLTQTVLYASKRERETDYASVVQSARQAFTKLEQYLASTGHHALTVATGLFQST